jgi:hypothetical protein
MRYSPYDKTNSRTSVYAVAHTGRSREVSFLGESQGEVHAFAQVAPSPAHTGRSSEVSFLGESQGEVHAFAHVVGSNISEYDSPNSTLKSAAVF